MEARKRRAIVLQATRYVGNYVRAKILGRQNVLPYFALLYVTHNCNLSCEFCSREQEVLGTDKKTMDLARTRVVLAQIRKLVSTLYVSGGEPLTLRDIEQRLDIARELQFWPVLMNTNATLLHRHWGVLQRIDTLVVSLHTTDPAKLAAIYKTTTPGQAKKALENIKEAARRAQVPGNAQVMANCVLTPDNVFDADGVLDFCLQHNIELAVVPAIVGQKPLIESGPEEQRDAYVRFLNRVIAQKKRSRRSIQGTVKYLEGLRDLRKFKCRPDGMMPVSPDGYLVHPCDDLFRKVLGRVDENTSALSILQSTSDFRAPFRACKHRCLKACYAQTAALIEDPPEVLREYLSRR